MLAVPNNLDKECIFTVLLCTFTTNTVYNNSITV